MMDIAEAKATIRKAALTTGKFQVVGYVSSEGVKSTMTVQFLRPFGYEDLMKESLEQLKEGAIEFPETPNIYEEDWNEAVQQQILSLESRIKGDGVEREESRPPMGEEHAGDPVRVRSGEDGFCVDNLRILEREVLEKPEVTKNYRSAVTHAKAILRTLLALNDYCGRLTFTEGKFESIRIV